MNNNGGNGVETRHALSLQSMEVFPEFRGRRLFGEIGALVVKKDVSRYAEKAGLYMLTQTSEGGAALINRKNFRAKAFS